MQKLEERDTYTHIPDVHGNCGLSLNPEETLAGLKKSSNNSDADLTGLEKLRDRFLLQKPVLCLKKEHDNRLSSKPGTFQGADPSTPFRMEAPLLVNAVT